MLLFGAKVSKSFRLYKFHYRNSIIRRLPSPQSTNWGLISSPNTYGISPTEKRRFSLTDTACNLLRLLLLFLPKLYFLLS